MISINYGWLFWLLINSFGNWKIKLFLRVVYYFMHLLWFPHCVIRALTNKSKNMREIFLIKSAKKFGASRRLCVWLGSSLFLRALPPCHHVSSSPLVWYLLLQSARSLVVRHFDLMRHTFMDNITNAHARAITLRA